MDTVTSAVTGLVVVIVTDIIDQEGPDSSSVVGGGDGSVSLLACFTIFTSLTSPLATAQLTCRIPDLSLDGLPINLNGSCSELNSDG